MAKLQKSVKQQREMAAKASAKVPQLSPADIRALNNNHVPARQVRRTVVPPGSKQQVRHQQSQLPLPPYAPVYTTRSRHASLSDPQSSERNQCPNMVDHGYSPLRPAEAPTPGRRFSQSQICSPQPRMVHHANPQITRTRSRSASFNQHRALSTYRGSDVTRPGGMTMVQRPDREIVRNPLSQFSRPRQSLVLRTSDIPKEAEELSTSPPAYQSGRYTPSNYDLSPPATPMLNLDSVVNLWETVGPTSAKANRDQASQANPASPISTFSNFSSSFPHTDISMEKEAVPASSSDVSVISARTHSRPGSSNGNGNGSVNSVVSVASSTTPPTSFKAQMNQTPRTGSAKWAAREERLRSLPRIRPMTTELPAEQTKPTTPSSLAEPPKTIVPLEASIPPTHHESVKESPRTRSGRFSLSIFTRSERKSKRSQSMSVASGSIKSELDMLASVIPKQDFSVPRVDASCQDTMVDRIEEPTTLSAQLPPSPPSSIKLPSTARSSLQITRKPVANPKVLIEQEIQLNTSPSLKDDGSGYELFPVISNASSSPTVVSQEAADDFRDIIRQIQCYELYTPVEHEPEVRISHGLLKRVSTESPTDQGSSGSSEISLVGQSQDIKANRFAKNSLTPSTCPSLSSSLSHSRHSSSSSLETNDDDSPQSPKQELPLDPVEAEKLLLELLNNLPPAPPVPRRLRPVRKPSIRRPKRPISSTIHLDVGMIRTKLDIDADEIEEDGPQDLPAPVRIPSRLRLGGSHFARGNAPLRSYVVPGDRDAMDLRTMFAAR